MRSMLLLVALGLPLAGWALTPNEAAELSRAGVSDAVIVAQIAADGQRHFLSADTILRLQSEGVSDPVILALIQSGSRPPTAAPSLSLTEQRRALDRARAAQPVVIAPASPVIVAPRAPWQAAPPWAVPAWSAPAVPFSYTVTSQAPLFVNGRPGVYPGTLPGWSAPVCAPAPVIPYRPVRFDPPRPAGGITIIVRSHDGG